MEQHCCVTVCVYALVHTYLSKNRHRVVWPSVLAQHWPNCGYIIIIARGGQYLLGRDILLLAFVSLSRELVRLHHALEWRQ